MKLKTKKLDKRGFRNIALHTRLYMITDKCCYLDKDIPIKYKYILYLNIVGTLPPPQNTITIYRDKKRFFLGTIRR